MRTIHRTVCMLFLSMASVGEAADKGFIDVYAGPIEALLQGTFADGNSGMVIGLVDKHGSRVFSAGKLDNGTDAMVDGDTVFEIGSTTKTFTVLLLLDMVRRGEMKLDDPVAKYLPEHVKMPAHGAKEVTLLNLAAQDSGLPFDADNLSSKPFPENYNEYTVRDLHVFLSEYKLTSEPGTSFQYSNIGMSLLGHVIERKAGADYDTLVVDRICRPLHMDETRVKLTPDLKARLAIGHDHSGQRAAHLNMKVMAPTGSLHSTANDLLKYLSANLGFRHTKLTPLMQDMQVVRHTGSGAYGKSAMPWFDFGVYNPPGSLLLGHTGGTAGFSTFVGFDQKQRRGVVVLSNQKALPSGSIGFAILQGMPLTRKSATTLVRQHVGIGVALGADEKTGAVKILRVFSKSSAKEAGLTAGLVIHRINGATAIGKTPKECFEMMGGPIGTKIRLDLFDPETDATRSVELSKQEFLTTTE